MKKFVKQNTVVILILFIFGTIFLNADYTLMQDYKQENQNRNTLIEQCQEKEIVDEEEKKFCESIVSSKPIKRNFYTAFSEVLVWKIQYVYYLAFFIVTIPSMFQICKMLRRKQIINSSTRESYKSFF